jgi:hypothetical protein
MKRKASISHEEATVCELRDNGEFAADCQVSGTHFLISAF